MWPLGNPSTQGLGAQVSPGVHGYPVTARARPHPRAGLGSGTLHERVARVTADVTGRPGPAEPRPLPQLRAGKGGRGPWASLSPRQGPALLRALTAPGPGARLPYLARSPGAGAARGPGAPGSGART